MPRAEPLRGATRVAVRVAVHERRVAVALRCASSSASVAARRPSPCDAHAGMIASAGKPARIGSRAAGIASRTCTCTERNFPPAFGANAAVGRRSGPVPGTSPASSSICAPLQMPITNLPACAPSITASITSSCAATAPARTRSSYAKPPGSTNASNARSAAEPRLQCTISRVDAGGRERALRLVLRCSFRETPRRQRARSCGTRRGSRRVEIAQRRRPRFVQRVERAHDPVAERELVGGRRRRRVA